MTHAADAPDLTEREEEDMGNTAPAACREGPQPRDDQASVTSAVQPLTGVDVGTGGDPSPLTEAPYEPIPSSPIGEADGRLREAVDDRMEGVRKSAKRYALATEAMRLIRDALACITEPPTVDVGAGNGGAG